MLDDLDAALAAGLLREDGVDRMRFAHALVRDTVYAGLSRTRRGRMHANAAGSSRTTRRSPCRPARPPDPLASDAGGQVDELRSVVPELGGVTVARAYLEAPSIDLSLHWWFSTMESVMAAEAALYTGLRDLAADAYAALSEFSGQPACAGSGTALGP